MDFRILRRLLPIPALVQGCLLLAACMGCGDDRFIVVGTATASSTSGFVEIDSDDDDGAEITVHMAQLHPVERIDPSAKSYMVWLDGGQGAPLRAGKLKYNPEQRTGELKTRSPFLKFVVKITAEASDNPSTPSDVVVATQDIAVDN
jgi:hypothetical protein